VRRKKQEGDKGKKGVFSREVYGREQGGGKGTRAGRRKWRGGSYVLG